MASLAVLTDAGSVFGCDSPMSADLLNQAPDRSIRSDLRARFEYMFVICGKDWTCSDASASFDDSVVVAWLNDVAFSALGRFGHSESVETCTVMIS
jgi:hypothetical protein